MSESNFITYSKTIPKLLPIPKLVDFIQHLQQTVNFFENIICCAPVCIVLHSMWENQPINHRAHMNNTDFELDNDDTTLAEHLRLFPGTGDFDFINQSYSITVLQLSPMTWACEHSWLDDCLTTLFCIYIFDNSCNRQCDDILFIAIMFCIFAWDPFFSCSNQSPIAHTHPQSGWCHIAAKEPCHEEHATTWLGWAF